MKKGWLGVVALMVVGAAQASWVKTGGTIANETWSLTTKASGENLQITKAAYLGEAGTTATLDLTDIPADCDGKKIVGIGTGAFQNVTALSEFVGPDVVRIESQLVFSGCSALTSVTLSPEISYIGTKTFSNLSNLQSFSPLEMPNLMTLGNSAFYSCTSLKGTFVLNSLATIPSYAFQDCKKITSVVAPNATSIETSAFYGSGIIEANFPLVTSIKTTAFRSCPNLESATFSPDLDSLGSEIFRASSNLKTFSPTTLKVEILSARTFQDAYLLTGDFVLPICTNIADQSFQSTKITSITAPNVISIGTAFHNCAELKRAEFGNALKSISGSSQNGSFYGCGKLETFTPFLPTSMTTLKGISFYGCKILGQTLVVDSPELKEFADGQIFRDCRSLWNIVFKYDFETIGNDVFKSCGLDSGHRMNLTFYGGTPLKTLSSSAFSFCSDYPIFRLKKNPEAWKTGIPNTTFTAVDDIQSKFKTATYGYPADDKVMGYLQLGTSASYVWLVDETPPNGTVLTVM